MPTAYGVVWAIGQLGGYRTQAVPTGLVSWGQLGAHLRATGASVAVLFGCHFPELHGWLYRGLGVAHLLGVGLVVLAIARTVRLAWQGTGNRTDEVITAGILLNLVAFVMSALNTDLLGITRNRTGVAAVSGAGAPDLDPIKRTLGWPGCVGRGGRCPRCASRCWRWPGRSPPHSLAS